VGLEVEVASEEEMRALRKGKEVKARETALMMKGRAESLTGCEGWVARELRRVVSGVRFSSSA